MRHFEQNLSRVLSTFAKATADMLSRGYISALYGAGVPSPRFINIPAWGQAGSTRSDSISLVDGLFDYSKVDP